MQETNYMGILRFIFSSRMVALFLLWFGQIYTTGALSTAFFIGFLVFIVFVLAEAFYLRKPKTIEQQIIEARQTNQAGRNVSSEEEDEVTYVIHIPVIPILALIIVGLIVFNVLT